MQTASPTPVQFAATLGNLSTRFQARILNELRRQGYNPAPEELIAFQAVATKALVELVRELRSVPTMPGGSK